jgi:hypothetical protein
MTVAQSPTQTLQIYTPGPATIFATSVLSLPQKEHRFTVSVLTEAATSPPLPRCQASPDRTED